MYLIPLLKIYLFVNFENSFSSNKKMREPLLYFSKLPNLLIFQIICRKKKINHNSYITRVLKLLVTELVIFLGCVKLPTLFDLRVLNLLPYLTKNGSSSPPCPTQLGLHSLTPYRLSFIECLPLFNLKSQAHHLAQLEIPSLTPYGLGLSNAPPPSNIDIE